MSNKDLHNIGAHGQRGVALIMALVFLVLLTILGITAMNTTNLQERMAGNSKDQNLAFQAAESALLDGENFIIAQTSKPNFAVNTGGLYVPSTTGTPWWDDSMNIWTAAASFAYSGTLTDINTQPRYIIEDMGEVQETGGSKVLPGAYKGKGDTIARITARGTGGTDLAQVIVQSTYARQY
ncbi:MAG: pilus assembly PilX family protein [Sulfuricaulis sp.]